MNEKIWHDIFRRYIEDFHAIEKLKENGIADDGEAEELKKRLLHDIIVTFKSEVEE